MSFDDPFKQLRDLNRQFDELRDLGRSPLEEIAETARQQLDLYENSIPRLSELLGQVETFSTLATQAQGHLAEAVAARDAIASSGFPKEIEALRKQWGEYEAFYEARDVASKNVIESQAVAAAIADAAAFELATSEPLAALQQSLQLQLQEIDNLREALPALKLEEQIGHLSQLLMVPQTVAQLSSFGDLIRVSELGLQPSINLFEQVQSLAASLELPYLDIAAQQWTEALGSIPDILASQSLLGSTLATIATVAAMAAAEDDEPTQNVFLVWKQIVDAQIARFGPDSIPNWLQGFLVNLLFLLLGLVFSVQGTKQINERIARIEAGQARIVQEIEAESARSCESQDARDYDLELLRDALNSLTEAEEETGDASNLLITSVNLRLRSEPSTEAAILMTIPQGQAVEFLEQADDWSKVAAMNFTLGEMSTGWVATEYLDSWESLDE